MKKLLLVSLVLHILLEGGVGILLAFSPTVFVPAPAPEVLSFLVNLGTAMIAVALVAVWLWPQRSNTAALTVGLGVIATYHTVQALAGLMMLARTSDATAIILHGVLGLMFWFLWLRRSSLGQAAY